MTRRTAFWLWLPLALSFTMMMLEGPTVQSAMARLAQPALHLVNAAGLGLGVALRLPGIPVASLALTAATLVESVYLRQRADG